MNQTKVTRTYQISQQEFAQKLGLTERIVDIKRRLNSSLKPTEEGLEINADVVIEVVTEEVPEQT